MWNLIKGEPVLFQGVIQAALALAVAFGSGLSSVQIGAILAFSAAVLSWVTRSQVTPLAKVPGNGGKPLAIGNAGSGV
jgi:hypothetical protein